MKKTSIDLIISDIEMPDLDGISMCKLALSINPMVKIILVSAYDKFDTPSVPYAWEPMIILKNLWTIPILPKKSRTPSYN